MNIKMPHIVLLGDSIFDNIKYVPDGMPVIEHLRTTIPINWNATLLAVDGDTTVDVSSQLKNVPDTATHLVISIGGNDAIEYIPIFSDRVSTVGEALLQLSSVQELFQQNYQKMLKEVMQLNLPVTVCTIYDSVPGHGGIEKTALALFNDIILKVAISNHVSVIDLRFICNEETDYSMISPIEPSHAGGMKIAKAVSLLLGGGLEPTNVFSGIN